MNKFFPLTLAMLSTTVLFAGTDLMAQTAPETTITRVAAQTRADEAFARLDANSDGQLNASDREGAAQARFNASDTDNNGQLSFAEVTTAREARRGDRNGQDRTRRGPGGDGTRMGGRMNMRADADSNGAVSQAEFTTAALARFDRVDTNSDGTISVEERQARRGDRGGNGRGDRRRNRG